jgi:glycosyltransferase involved in cell wall biosynthesis
MKLLVFAHTPPPFHGQSYMVKLMLDGVQTEQRDGDSQRLQIFHVNARLSSNLATIGKFQWSKIFLLLKYCCEAYFLRFIHKANTFYYVPAPGLRAAIYRDWIVMFFCRPIFKKIIFHWHAVGLGEWLETTARPWERKITLWLLGRADLSIVLSEFSRADAMRFSPRRVEIAPNGIPDPCEDFDKSILPTRQRRFRSRITGLEIRFSVLFIGACTTAKGLFAALDAVALVNRQLAETKKRIAIQFIVAGDFASEEEREKFRRRISEPDLSRKLGASGNDSIVVYKGFVESAEKRELFREADCLCFPSLYPAEGQPVTIVEALAFGLGIVATRWRGIPELLAGTNAQLVDDQNSIAIATALIAAMNVDSALTNRRVFLDRYRVDKFIRQLTGALLTVD